MHLLYFKPKEKKLISENETAKANCLATEEALRMRNIHTNTEVVQHGSH
jgi:hypothetical protein